MKALSLRSRLTLLTMAAIALIAIVLTLASMLNADNALQNFVTAIEDNAMSSSSEGESTTTYEAAASQAQARVELDFQRISLLLMLVIIVIGGIAVYFVLGYALRPLHTLTERIGGISAHALDSRVAVSQTGGEIHRLAEAFNKLLARLQAAFESQKRFSGAAAHELKTPLAIIKTNIDVLRMLPKPTTDDYEQALSAASDQTERMIALVDDLLAISNEESYEMPDQVRLPDLLHEIIDDLRPAASEKRLRITLEGESYRELPCNAVMLRTALTNILENAVKYNVMDGSVGITVWDEPHKSILRVNDTGIGIPDDAAGRIFEPFYRVDTSRSRKIAGAGLGLAIAKDTIKRHGGTITYRKNEYGGSSFTIELPFLL